MGRYARRLVDCYVECPAVRDLKRYAGRRVRHFAERVAGHAVELTVDQYGRQCAAGSEAGYLALGTTKSVLYHLQ